MQKEYPLSKLKGVIVLDAAHVMALSSETSIKKDLIPEWGYEIGTARFPIPFEAVRDKEVFTYVKLNYLRNILTTAEDLGMKGEEYGQVKITFAPNSFIKVSWGKTALYLAPIDPEKQNEYESEIHISTAQDSNSLEGNE